MQLQQEVSATVETPPRLVKRKFTYCDYSCQLWPINLNCFAGFPKKKWCHPQYLLGSEISLKLNAMFPVALSLPWGSLFPVYVWRGLLPLLEISQVNSVCLFLEVSGYLFLRETWSPREMIVSNMQKFLIIVLKMQDSYEADDRHQAMLILEIILRAR